MRCHLKALLMYCTNMVSFVAACLVRKMLRYKKYYKKIKKSQLETSYCGLVIFISDFSSSENASERL